MSVVPTSAGIQLSFLIWSWRSSFTTTKRDSTTQFYRSAKWHLIFARSGKAYTKNKQFWHLIKNYLSRVWYKTHKKTLPRQGDQVFRPQKMVGYCIMSLFVVAFRYRWRCRVVVVAKLKNCRVPMQLYWKSTLKSNEQWKRSNAKEQDSRKKSSGTRLGNGNSRETKFSNNLRHLTSITYCTQKNKAKTIKAEEQR